LKLQSPESYRLLNIALIDIGAGTSDIAITKGGSIIAYGMIPFAGDEITECIVHEYLVDFQTAEKIKIAASGKAKTISFKDAIGLKQTIELEQVRQIIVGTTELLAESIAQKIKELNGQHSTNAVFIVGGGGQTLGFEELLAQKLNIPKQRVAIRGKDVLTHITSEEGTFKKKPEFVTPIGICLTGLNNNAHDFVEVFLNDESIRIFNTNRLTIMDVVALKGIDPKSFIPRRGKKISYTLNGELQIINGELGELAKIYINQKEADLSHSIKMHDYITIIPAIDGKERKPMIKEVLGEIYITINNIKKMIPIQVLVNKQIKNPMNLISDGDSIEYVLPTVREVLETFEVDYTDVFLNEQPNCSEVFIKNGDIIHTFVQNTSSQKEQESSSLRNSVTQESNVQSTYSDCLITVNQTPVCLKGKPNYIFVDIFDFYPFDRTVAKGTLITLRNGVAINYLDQLTQGDTIDLYWKT
jgi:cell division ATPase FtsA